MRSRTHLAVYAVLLFAASSASAATYTLSGKFTASRGKTAQIPLVGLTPNAGALQGCGGLTLMSGPGIAGTMTPPATMSAGVNDRGGMDLGCMPHAAGGVLPGVGKKLTTTGMGVGGQFTLPTVA